MSRLDEEFQYYGLTLKQLMQAGEGCTLLSTRQGGRVCSCTGPLQNSLPVVLGNLTCRCRRPAPD